MEKRIIKSASKSKEQRKKEIEEMERLSLDENIIREENNIFTGDYVKDGKILVNKIKELQKEKGRDLYKIGGARMKKFGIRLSVGGSVLYGDTWRQNYGAKIREYDEKRQKYITRAKSLFPELQRYFNMYRDKHFPNFHFTQIQMNRNFRIPRHLDGTNVGKSWLSAVSDNGEYIGGDLNVEYPNEEGGLKKIDARISPICFNGSKLYHYVDEWSKGDRYSFVFFHN